MTSKIGKLRRRLNVIKRMIYNPYSWPDCWDELITEIDGMITEIMVSMVQTEDKYEMIKFAMVEMKARQCKKLVLMAAKKVTG